MSDEKGYREVTVKIMLASLETNPTMVVNDVHDAFNDKNHALYGEYVASTLVESRDLSDEESEAALRGYD